MRYDSMAASDRLSEAYLFVSRMEDLSQKVDGLARMVGLLEDIDPDREMEQSEGLHSLAQQDLESATQPGLLRDGGRFAPRSRPIYSEIRIYVLFEVISIKIEAVNLLFRVFLIQAAKLTQ